MSQIALLIEKIKELPRVVIQAHDFPDHDAVASAFALGYLLEQQGIPVLLVYNGMVDRISLKNLIEILQIDIKPWKDSDVHTFDKIITVDGCIGEKNVLDLPGDEIAVIDHHQVNPPENLWYCDVRPEYGATATIIYEYYQELGVAMPTNVATALQVGLNVDTANLTRGFVQADIAAFSALHELADPELVNRITRNCMTFAELKFYGQLLSNVSIENGIGCAWLSESCPKNMLGVLGDFLIAIDEIHTTILATPQDDIIQVSLRTENTEFNVGQLAFNVLNQNQIGFGGGHWHMAGGMVDIAKFEQKFTTDRFFKLFLSQLK